MGYYVIEGNIGAGKTTLARQLANRLKIPFIPEQAEHNPYLPLFYENNNKYAFTLELSLLAERYQQLRAAFKDFSIARQTFIADYGIFKSLLFAEVNLTPEEFLLFKKIYKTLVKLIPDPKLTLILKQSASDLSRKIRKRGRIFEKSISENYLKKITRVYEKYIKKKIKRNIIVIELNKESDLEDSKVVDYILEVIENQKDKHEIFQIYIGSGNAIISS